MDRQYIFIIVLAVLAGGFTVLVTVAGGIWKTAYDERQLLAQGRAFKYGFVTMVLLGLLYVVVDAGTHGKFLSGGDAMVTVIGAGLGVTAVYCIVKDAYISVNGRMWPAMVTMGILIVRELFETGDALDPAGGEGMSPVPHIVLLCVCAACLTAMVVKTLLDRRGGE